jgi:hypothetical protein
VAAAADPYSKFTAIETGFQDGSRVCSGWIVDGTAIANAYRVQVEKLGATIVAAPLSQSSQSCLGATVINSYVPGSCVVVLLDDRSLRGYILGAAPDVLFSGQQAVSHRTSRSCPANALTTATRSTSSRSTVAA